MSEQLPSTFDQLPTSPILPVKLWIPTVIGVTTLFLGFPAGLVLASINWIRMGLKNKAVSHLIGGAIGTFVFTIILMLTPGSLARSLGLGVNVGVWLYLQSQTKKDIELFRANSHVVENANGFGGCLIGLGVTVLFLALIFIIAVLFAMVGIQTPE